MSPTADAYRPRSAPYEDPYAYLADALRKLDARLALRTAAFRAEVAHRSETSSPHLYISHERVDQLLYGAPAAPPDTAALRARLDALQAEIDGRVAESLRQGVYLGLPRLVQLFNLSAFERETLLICLAPELRRSYDTLYAYLQDDITRKRPSVALVLDLLCNTEAARWQARAWLTPPAPLFRTGLLDVVEDPHSPSGTSGLAQFLQIDPRLLQFILGRQVLDARLVGLAEVRRGGPALDALPLPASVRTAMTGFAEAYFGAVEAGQPGKPVLHLHGPYGVGKRALAEAVCARVGCALLCLDAEALLDRGEDAEGLLRRAFRESLLLQAPLALERADVFLGDTPAARTLRKALALAVDEYGWFVFLLGEKPWLDRGLFESATFHSLALPVPEVPLREQAWRDALNGLADADDTLPARLARRFRITPGRIRHATAACAADRLLAPAPNAAEAFDPFDVLAAACREQSALHLGELARKTNPHYGWDDLILPEERLTQLREICAQVRHRYRVFSEWGFDRKLGHGKGISVLFSGPPGTGKTMAAEVLARDLALDLYKIDLSRVVSKYIGETEKNLARIFDEAEHSDAILFFDEADALFGKRTEISDAHDRYANIETSYLLQQMEAYDGVVILASNLRENMDSAFLRRIRFIVEFPFPDAASRLRIWQSHFPREAPVSDAVDYELLAERIQVAGGNIKNIVLSAAFFAAENGGMIGMEHILRGTRREYEKIGKLWDERRFADGVKNKRVAS